MVDESSAEAIMQRVRSGVDTFASEAHVLLGRFETAKASRVIAVDESRRQLKGLSLQQEGLFAESLECVSHGLFRAAIVSAWQAYMDLLDAKLASDGLHKIRSSRSKWPQHGSIEDLREAVNEYQRIEVARELALIDKATMKTLHGMLSTRNACAHTSSYRPSLNVSLGYVSDLIDRSSVLLTKTL